MVIFYFYKKAVRRLISRFFPTDCDNFVDLCSIANISVIFFDSPLHGIKIYKEVFIFMEKIQILEVMARCGS